MVQPEKWVWFDLDDTLHDFTSAAGKAGSYALQRLAEGTGQSLDTVKNNYRAILAKHNLLCFADGRSSHEYRTERFLAALGETATVSNCSALIEEVLESYETLYMSALALKQGARETLQKLRDNKYKLAILTDAPEDAQSRVIERLNIGDFFDAIFTSGRLMISKKNGMCRCVLDNLNAAPSNVVMIGDSIEKDIEPALAAKIGAIWFNEKNAPNGNGYRTINVLTQLSQELSLF